MRSRLSLGYSHPRGRLAHSDGGSLSEVSDGSFTASLPQTDIRSANVAEVRAESQNRKRYGSRHDWEHSGRVIHLASSSACRLSCGQVSRTRYEGSESLPEHTTSVSTC